MRTRTNLVTVCTLATLALGALAGPISPSAGPVGPTMKTLAEVEPRIAINAANTPGDATSSFKITQPGSYYLTGNITGAAGKHGIAIASSDVTLDLGGFAMIGVAGASSGVRITQVSARNITVRNGSVRDWPQYGLQVGEPSDNNFTKGGLIERVTATNNGVHGIVAGESFVVTKCGSSGNQADGILCHDSTRVSECSASENGSSGIYTMSSCTVTGSTANDNGETGIGAGDDSAISGCNVYHNQGWGIAVGGGAMVQSCTVGRNQTGGIVANGNLSDASIIDNVCERNLDVHILVNHRSVVRGNRCASSTTGVDGIRVAGSRNRIEGNHCTGGTLAISVLASGTDNVVFGNTSIGAASGFAWVTPNNIIGPVITAKGTITSTSPFANFQY